MEKEGESKERGHLGLKSSPKSRRREPRRASHYLNREVKAMGLS